MHLIFQAQAVLEPMVEHLPGAALAFVAVQKRTLLDTRHDENPDVTDIHPDAPRTPEDVISFWKQAGPGRWFKKDEAFDQTFRSTFAALHFQAARRELEHWLDSAEGALALLILLDQYPRNAFRGTAHMFATDPLARAYARQMIDAGQDLQVEQQLRAFCYLPFEHSECAEDQQLSLRLNHSLDPNSYKWAQEHADIIERFSRFPHRNQMLARVTTPEEQAFLDDGGFKG